MRAQTSTAANAIPQRAIAAGDIGVLFVGGGATGSSAYALGPNALRALHARQTDANGSFIAPHFAHRSGCGVSEGCTPTSYQHYTGTNA